MRITVIQPSGKVLGDSEADPKTMENHSDRPEFVKAMSGETGVFTRYSHTLQDSMMYLAVPLLEGNNRIGVLRASVSIGASIDSLRKFTSALLSADWWSHCWQQAPVFCSPGASASRLRKSAKARNILPKGNCLTGCRSLLLQRRNPGKDHERHGGKSG